MPVGSPQGQLDVFPGDDLVGTGHCLYSLRLPYWSYDSEFFLYVYGSQRCSAAGSALLCSIVLSPALVMVFELLKILPFDPLFLGIAASAVLCGIGYTVRQAKL